MSKQGETLLRVENLCQYFGRNKAVDNVSFEVKKGQVVGFVGSNGAGKSTLLKIIAGVMKPTKGNIEIYGNVCPMIELGAGFDMDLTARENIYLNGAILGYSKEFIDELDNEIEPEFTEGNIIYHEKYGRGVIEKIMNYGNKTLCSIQFEEVGRRLLDPNLAGLKQV